MTVNDRIKTMLADVAAVDKEYHGEIPTSKMVDFFHDHYTLAPEEMQEQLYSAIVGTLEHRGYNFGKKSN